MYFKKRYGDQKNVPLEKYFFPEPVGIQQNEIHSKMRYLCRKYKLWA